MFMLVSRRYERASLIVTSNKPFSAWGEIFGDDATAAAMIDRLVHHAEILSLKGDSYRLKDQTSAPAPPPEPRNGLTDHLRHLAEGLRRRHAPQIERQHANGAGNGTLVTYGTSPGRLTPARRPRHALDPGGESSTARRCCTSARP